MDLLWWLLGSVALLPAGAAAPDPLFANTLDGVACFESLKAPDYPAAAVEKKMDGFVWATVQVSAEGKIVSIDTDVISDANGASAGAGAAGGRGFASREGETGVLRENNGNRFPV